MSYNNVPVAYGEHKASLGQYFTPLNVARYMVSLMGEAESAHYHLLDAGAGEGALSCAFIERFRKELPVGATLKVTAFEYDQALIPILKANIYAASGFDQEIVQGDFIEIAASQLSICASSEASYSHVILNPPYKKIRSDSHHRALLRTMGIETTNLYAGFIGVALLLTKTNGQIVALIPRSFCTGPYFKRFREFLLGRAAIRHIHLFESRNSIFRDDDVLQENIIIKLECGGIQSEVVITSSIDDSLTDVKKFRLPFSRVVRPDDLDLFIHIPGPSEEENWPSEFSNSLAGLGVQVSTGPVVDFRATKFLTAESSQDTVPLIYPAHLKDSRVVWPLNGLKKSQYLMNCVDTRRQLFPLGNYCVIRRFSAKEQERRIVSAVACEVQFNQFNYLGFENHLNVIHSNRQGLELNFALGLTAFLNSKYADMDIRTFNGHTQVNAADIKKLRFPNKVFLMALGDRVLQLAVDPEKSLDILIDNLLNEKREFHA